MAVDKKAEGGTLRFILLERLGAAPHRGDVPPTPARDANAPVPGRRLTACAARREGAALPRCGNRLKPAGISRVYSQVPRE